MQLSGEKPDTKIERVLTIGLFKIDFVLYRVVWNTLPFFGLFSLFYFFIFIF